MGGSISLNKINFEDMQTIIQNKDAIIISTLSDHRQNCLLVGTLNASEEVSILNEIITNGGSTHKNIVVYGENCCDDSIAAKCSQLTNLGFTNVYVYMGGLFEWLLLQDIYGHDLFPTTYPENDLLKFKGRKKYGIKLIEE